MGDICKIRIHPAIGVARLGNSLEEFFLAPEIPGKFERPAGGYKDREGRIKRQVQRFRLFGYDALDRPIGEITAKDAQIRWTVHVKNCKGAYREFAGLSRDTPLRNAKVSHRESLVIDPGAATLSGPRQRASFDAGRFLGKRVPLGEARTDEHGRLLVFGGFGHSESVPVGAPLPHFANNDGWHDDCADGPVSAEVHLNGSPIEVVPAWVICSPPDFAPEITSIITLYDVLYQRALNEGALAEPLLLSFTRDVYPLLVRALGMGWVSSMAAMSHQTLPPAFGFATPLEMRRAIVSHLRDPALAFDVESESDMPMIWSDHYPDGQNQALLPFQYARLEKWSLGQCVDDWTGAAEEPGQEITPSGLDRAALEACVGAPCFPGIDAGWRLRDVLELAEPFRLSHATSSAGCITEQLAVPWQADFADCTQDGEYAWWPSQRPDDVWLQGKKEQVPWIRGFVESPEDMVQKWSRLGFVVRHADGFFESERGHAEPTDREASG